MTPSSQNEVINSTFKHCKDLLQSKGAAYAENSDVLSNFKKIAITSELAPTKVWAVYFQKHFISIMKALNENPWNPEELSEGMDGRIHDAINYLVLLKCLLVEIELNKPVKEAKEVYGSIIEPLNPVITLETWRPRTHDDHPFATSTKKED